MKILFVTYKYPPKIGGMETHSFELLKNLKENNEVRMMIIEEKQNKLSFFFSVTKQVKELLKNEPDIDVIYANDALLACFAVEVRKFSNIPVVATVHGLDVVFPNTVYQKIIRNQLPKLAALIAVSEATKSECINRGVAAEKVFVVKNGVDHTIADFSFDQNKLAAIEKKLNISLDGKKILAAMGRPVKRKGFSWFVNNVMPKLDKEVILLMIGPRKGSSMNWLKFLPTFLRKQFEIFLSIAGDEWDLRKAIKKVGKERVIETGKLPFAEIVQLMKAADLFVMPNLEVKGDMEGFGLVTLESAICGTPVVASNLEGIKDAIQEGKNGFLLPPQDVEKWAELINKLLQDKENLKTFGEQAKKYTLSEFSWEKMAAEYKQIFEQCVSKRIKT